jgi:hypothetical protein
MVGNKMLIRRVLLRRKNPVPDIQLPEFPTEEVYLVSEIPAPNSAADGDNEEAG